MPLSIFQRIVNIYTSISTEEYLVSIDDSMPMMIWADLFIKEQSFELNIKIIHKYSMNFIHI